MLDNKKILIKITKNKKFKLRISKPFDEKNFKFLVDFSNELKKNKKIYEFPELFYLMFWCNKRNIDKLKKKHASEKIRLGRGLIFHICPSNVPTNFIYSFFFISNIPSIFNGCFNFKKRTVIKRKFF